MATSERESRLAGRDARDGRFITVEKARNNPDTSVVERLPLPGHGVKLLTASTGVWGYNLSPLVWFESPQHMRRVWINN